MEILVLRDMHAHPGALLQQQQLAQRGGVGHVEVIAGEQAQAASQTLAHARQEVCR